MKRTLPIVSLFLLLGNLFCNNASFEKSKYANFCEPYLGIDTVVFYSSSSFETDTMMINNWDTIVQKGSFQELPGQLIQIHSIQEGQEVIFISFYDSQLSGKDDCMEIRYKDFWGCLDDVNDAQKDGLLSDFGIEEYWVINTDRPARGLSDASIVEVFWTKELGLTKYNLKNGISFELKKSSTPPQK